MTSPAKPRGHLVPIFLSQGIGLACGLLGVRITSHLVPPEAFGQYGIFLTFTTLGAWVAYAGLIKFISRHWAETTDRAALLRGTKRAIGRKLPWLALATLPAALVLGLEDAPATFLALFAAALALTAAAIAQTALQAERSHWRDLAVGSVGSVTRSFVPPLLYTIGGGTVAALYWGFSLHALIFAWAGAWMLRRYFSPSRPSSGSAIKIPEVYEGPLFIALAIASWALVSLNRWIVAAFFGAEQAGYFTLASNLAVLIPSILGTIFLQYRQPEFFAATTATDANRHALARRVDQTALLHAAVALAGLFALRALAPWLIGPLISEAYRPALPLLLPAGCAMLAITTGLFYHALLLAGRKERACGPVELTAAVLLIASGLASAMAGEAWFIRWLYASALVPWVINRSLARHYFLRASV